MKTVNLLREEGGIVDDFSKVCYFNKQLFKNDILCLRVRTCLESPRSLILEFNSLPAGLVGL